MFVWLTAFLWTAAAEAETFYVSPQGSDQNSGTSPEQAFQTLNFAETAHAGGDTVWVMEGTYGLRWAEYLGGVIWPRSGSPGDWTLWAAYPGHKVVVDAMDHAIGDGQGKVQVHGAFHIVGTRDQPRRYIEIRGFHIKNHLDDEGVGIHVAYADSVRVRDNIVENTWDEGIKTWRCRRILIDNNQIARTQQIRTADEAVSISFTREFAVANNHLTDIPADGICIEDSSGRGEVRGNKVEGTTRTGIYLIHGVHDVNIHQNFVTACTNGIIVAAERDSARMGWPTRVERLHIYNNIVVHNRGDGIGITAYNDQNGVYAPGQDPLKNDIGIINNTVVGNGAGVAVASYNAEKIRVRNNVISGNWCFQFRDVTDAAAVSHNLIWGPRFWEKHEPFGEAAVQSEPRWCEQARFSPSADSPVRDAGTVMEAPRFDYHGEQRRELPDIGAVESAAQCSGPAASLGELVPVIIEAKQADGKPFEHPIHVLFLRDGCGGCECLHSYRKPVHQTVLLPGWSGTIQVRCAEEAPCSHTFPDAAVDPLSVESKLEFYLELR